MRRSRLALVATVSLFALSLHAQAQQAFGNIVVTADAGDAIVVYSPEVGVKKERTMEETGTTQFRRLPLGAYIVSITKPDGKVVETAVTLRAGQTGRAP